jgi:hypothetical protein
LHDRELRCGGAFLIGDLITEETEEINIPLGFEGSGWRYLRE